MFRQVLLVADTLKLGGTVLSAIPDMLAAQLVARLVSAVTVGVIHCKCTVYTSQHIFRLSGRIEPMVELIHCSHRTIYTNQTIGWDPIETERSKVTIPRQSRGDAKCQSPRMRA